MNRRAFERTICLGGIATFGIPVVNIDKPLGPPMWVGHARQQGVAVLNAAIAATFDLTPAQAELCFLVRAGCAARMS